MPKKALKPTPLTLTEIILRGDAETIRQALEARTQIDSLLEEREAAYLRIAELETQVYDIVGADADFPFPEPPMPVAEFAKAPPKKKASPKPATPKADPKPEEQKVANTPAASEEAAPAKPDDH